MLFSEKFLLYAVLWCWFHLNTDLFFWIDFDINGLKYNFIVWKFHCLYYETHFSTSWVQMSSWEIEVFESLRWQVLSEYLPNPLWCKWETFRVFTVLDKFCSILRHITELIQKIQVWKDVLCSMNKLSKRQLWLLSYKVKSQRYLNSDLKVFSLLGIQWSTCGSSCCVGKLSWRCACSATDSADRRP